MALSRLYYRMSLIEVLQEKYLKQTLNPKAESGNERKIGQYDDKREGIANTAQTE
jgi:hypothetical protein